MSGAPVPGARAVALIARLALVRLVRGRTLWITAPLTAVPLLLLGLSRDDLPVRWYDFLDAMTIALVLIPPIHVAGALAEELEDRTISYLWSRPLPRWSLIVGKLVGLAPPIAVALSAVTAVGYLWISGDPAAGPALLGYGAAAIALGALAVCCLSISIGCLIRKQSVAVAIGYLFVVDAPIGSIGYAVENLSFTHQILALGEASGIGAALAPAGWLVGLSAGWLAIALWRVSRAEFSAQE